MNLSYFKSKAVHLTIIVSCFVSSSCKKFIEVSSPLTQLVTRTVFANDKTANAAQLNIYQVMANNNNSYLSLYTSLSSDEITNYASDQNYVQLYKNSILADNTPVYNVWNAAYNCIYQENAVLAGLTSGAVSVSVKQQLTGEAEFIRAYWHFFLVNLFGDVPIITTPDYETNSNISRSAVTDVYQQIVADLKDAQSKLSANYLGSDATTPTVERLRPTKFAASALLARVYLFLNKPDSAEAQASVVINNSQTFSLLPTANLGSVFLRNSQEAIWQIAIDPNKNTSFNTAFSLTNGAPGTMFFAPGALSTIQLNAFESGDARRSAWIGNISYNGTTYFYPIKYTGKFAAAPFNEYEMVLRLAEQYLIRAEARAIQGNISGAQADLNAIRKRANLPVTTVATQSALLAVILKERQVELFTEGHRWLDLKRTGNIDAVMTSAAATKGTAWSPSAALYPIPSIDVIRNPKMTQNPGY